jgi:hypothetical protein
MAYDVAVFGSLKFRAGKYRAWRERMVDARDYRSVSRIFAKRETPAAVKVGDLLEELPLIAGHSMFELDAAGTTLQVRGLFSQHSFETRCRQLAALFLLSAEVGAEGDICFLGQGVFVGYGISIGDGRGMLMTLTEDQVQNASLDPDLDVISGYFHVADPTPNGVPPVIPSVSVRPELLQVPAAGRAAAQATKLLSGIGVPLSSTMPPVGAATSRVPDGAPRPRRS